MRKLIRRLLRLKTGRRRKKTDPTAPLTTGGYHVYLNGIYEDRSAPKPIRRLILPPRRPSRLLKRYLRRKEPKTRPPPPPAHPPVARPAAVAYNNPSPTFKLLRDVLARVIFKGFPSLEATTYSLLCYRSSHVYLNGIYEDRPAL